MKWEAERLRSSGASRLALRRRTVPVSCLGTSRVFMSCALCRRRTLSTDDSSSDTMPVFTGSSWPSGFLSDSRRFAIATAPGALALGTTATRGSAPPGLPAAPPSGRVTGALRSVTLHAPHVLRQHNPSWRWTPAHT